MDSLAAFEIPTNLKELCEQLKSGKTPQEIIGYSPEIMRQFYAAAYRLYQAGLDSEAADAFFFLTVLNPSVQVHWLALGMAEQCQKKYEDALIAYAMATLLKSDDPLPYYYSAVCYQALHEKENAQKSFQMALCYFGEEHASLKAHAEAMLASR